MSDLIENLAGEFKRAVTVVETRLDNLRQAWLEALDSANEVVLGLKLQARLLGLLGGDELDFLVPLQIKLMKQSARCV